MRNKFVASKINGYLKTTFKFIIADYADSLQTSKENRREKNIKFNGIVFL